MCGKPKPGGPGRCELERIIVTPRHIPDLALMAQEIADIRAAVVSATDAESQKARLDEAEARVLALHALTEYSYNGRPRQPRATLAVAANLAVRNVA